MLPQEFHISTYKIHHLLAMHSNSHFVVIFKFPTKERKKIKTSDTISKGASVSPSHKPHKSNNHIVDHTKIKCSKIGMYHTKFNKN